MIRHLAPAAALLALIAYPIIAPGAAYCQTVLLMAFLVAIQAISWNVISGFAGYISLGHSVFLGIGAYIVAIMSTRLSVNPLVLAPVGGVAATAVALLIGGVVVPAQGPAVLILTVAALLDFPPLSSHLPSISHC